MPQVKMTELPRTELAQFDWIVGPVYAAHVADLYDIALVYQGPGAYAVVRPSHQAYVACCPNERKAQQLIESLADALSDDERTRPV